MPGGDEIAESIINDSTTKYVTILYVIEEGGIIDGGDEEQIIVLGTNGDTVTAVADDGYVFDKWSDGVKTPTRTEMNVTEDLIITAEFVPIEEEGDGQGGGGDEGDMPSDQPGDEQQEGEGEGDGQQNGGPPQNGLQGGGKSQPNNQIINGEIYYRDPSIIEQYQDAADERTSSDDSGYTDDEIDLINKYLGIV
jgi:hypothetical protein